MILYIILIQIQIFCINNNYAIVKNLRQIVKLI